MSEDNQVFLIVQDQTIGKMVPLELDYDFIEDVAEGNEFRIRAIAIQIMNALKALRDQQTQ